jgi:DNA-directed RNA polymerase subunit RPC12/RpoP
LAGNLDCDDIDRLISFIEIEEFIVTNPELAATLGFWFAFKSVLELDSWVVVNMSVGYIGKEHLKIGPCAKIYIAAIVILFAAMGSLNDIMSMELRNMSDYTVARNWSAVEYHYNCSRCQQDFVLDGSLSRLITEGETEVETALCHDCQQKLLQRFAAIPFYPPDYRSCH